MSADSAALLAIEQRVRARIAARLTGIATNLGAYLSSIVAADQHTSALDLLSRSDVHATFTGVLVAAQDSVETTVRAGYTAAAAVATAAASRDLGETITGTGEPGKYLDAVLADIQRAFAAAGEDIRARVVAAHDAVTRHAGQGPARGLAARVALREAVSRLALRLDAAGTVAVNRAFCDAQLRIYQRFADAHPDQIVVKRWEVTSANPCPTCAGLDGTWSPLGDEFDHTATTAPDRYTPGIYHDLQSPPRHPHCHCRLVIDVRDAPEPEQPATA